MTTSAQLILASASPRRRELLEQIGISFQVLPVDIDEQPLAQEIAGQYVKRITTAKAETARQRTNSLRPILAADTAVVLDGMIMGKPENKSHGLQMLSALSGKTHQVYSAVSVLTKQHQQLVSVTDVTFRTISAHELQAYWDTGESLDKAGAYAIQGLASVFIESITGSFSGVMGLPLYETAILLKQAGIHTLTESKA